MKRPRWIYHITPREELELARPAGLYRAPSLDSEGFIHASTREQVLATAARFYAGQPGLVLLEIDTVALTSDLRYELAPAVGDFFPHIYGPINLSAVTRALPFEPDPATGEFSWPEEG